VKTHWESWLLRLALLATAAYQVISGNTPTLIAAARILKGAWDKHRSRTALGVARL
jgi:hypothetical protein